MKTRRRFPATRVKVPRDQPRGAMIAALMESRWDDMVAQWQLTLPDRSGTAIPMDVPRGHRHDSAWLECVRVWRKCRGCNAVYECRDEGILYRVQACYLCYCEVAQRLGA